jgi:molybdopterin biosynthesis enzyme
MRPGAPLGFGILGAREGGADGIPWIGPAGQPGVGDGDLRAVRPPRAAPNARPRAAIPPTGRRRDARGAGDHRRARLTHFLRAIVTTAEGDGTLTARLTGPQGSGSFTSMALAQRATRRAGGQGPHRGGRDAARAAPEREDAQLSAHFAL